LLGETLYELGMSCNVLPKEMNKYKALGHYPGPVALLFHIREQEFLIARGVKA
jgi:hypothetical protein